MSGQAIGHDARALVGDSENALFFRSEDDATRSSVHAFACGSSRLRRPVNGAPTTSAAARLRRVLRPGQGAVLRFARVSLMPRMDAGSGRPHTSST